VFYNGSFTTVSINLREFICAHLPFGSSSRKYKTFQLKRQLVLLGERRDRERERKRQSLCIQSKQYIILTNTWHIYSFIMSLHCTSSGLFVIPGLLQFGEKRRQQRGAGKLHVRRRVTITWDNLPLEISEIIPFRKFQNWHYPILLALTIPQSGMTLFFVVLLTLACRVHCVNLATWLNKFTYLPTDRTGLTHILMTISYYGGNLLGDISSS